jgi:CubicO group peptidase (beta-lactamase class C family)
LVTTGLILLWALAIAALVYAEAFWIGPPKIPHGDFAAIENHLVRKLNDATGGSAALVLLQGGKITAEHGFGIANTETGALVNLDRTLYVVASVSKAVTAWGVMKLVEEGRLALDEPVLTYLKRWRFPGSEAYRDKVTIRHLLSHTAGLDDGLGYNGFLPGEAIQTLEDSLSLTKDTSVSEPRPVKVAWEPGSAMAYSGGGYTILQLLIEEVTRRSFADYMKESVLRPLGMTKSSFDLDTIIAEGRAGDLATALDRWMRPSPARRYTAQAAVSLRTTPRDLAQFARAFTGENPVLKPETLRQMMMPQPGTSGSWGLGHTLYVRNDAGGYVMGHDGGTYPGWGAIVRVNPATGNGIVAMVSGARAPVSQLGDQWIYWETGKVRSEARLQMMQDRIIPASAAILLGAILIPLLRRRMSRRRQRS